MPRIGVKSTAGICYKCGRKLKLEEKICPNCGADNSRLKKYDLAEKFFAYLWILIFFSLWLPGFILPSINQNRLPDFFKPMYQYYVSNIGSFFVIIFLIIFILIIIMIIISLSATNVRKTLYAIEQSKKDQ